MRYLYTRCPYCRTSSYAKVKNENSIDIECPYCGQDYTDQVDEEYVKEADFYWELYINLYPPMREKFRRKSTLLIAGFLLSLSVAFQLLSKGLFLAGAVYTILTLPPLQYGLILSSMVFLGLTVMGIASSFLKYSFAMAVVGAIFGILNSVMWYMIGFYLDGSLFIFSISLNSLITFFFSSISLLIIVHNRWSFLRS